MSSSYRVVEPHPTATTPFIHTARGGAGNIAKASSTSRGSDASGPASRANIKPSRFVVSGRGGAGNVHHNTERAIFSFDEELKQQMRLEKELPPVYHVGRGGAGNMVYIDGSWRRKSSNQSNGSTKSDSSADSGADIATRNVRRSFERGWAKVTERF